MIRLVIFSWLLYLTLFFDFSGCHHEVLSPVLWPLCSKDHRRKASQVPSLCGKLWYQRCEACLYIVGCLNTQLHGFSLMVMRHDIIRCTCRFAFVGTEVWKYIWVLSAKKHVTGDAGNVYVFVAAGYWTNEFLLHGG